MIQAIVYNVSMLLDLSLLILAILSFVAAFTIAPKYERKFSRIQAGMFNPIFPNTIGRFFSRPAFYMLSILFGNTKRGSVQRKLYCGDYDFKAEAQPWEVIYSWIFVCVITVFMFSIFIFAFFYYGGRLFGLNLTIL